jgi:hypothetical protein
MWIEMMHVIRRYPRLRVFAYEYFVSLGRVTTHPQNPHTWRTSLSLSVSLRPDKIRSEVIRKELEISRIQGVRAKQTKLDQPPRKNGQHQTAETHPQLQTSREKRSRTPQDKMAER